MSDIEATVKRVLELAADERVTPGRWVAAAGKAAMSGLVRVTDEGDVAGVDIALCFRGRSDHELIAEYRTLAPQLAEWVQRVLPVIEATRELVAQIRTGYRSMDRIETHARFTKAVLDELDAPVQSCWIRTPTRRSTRRGSWRDEH